MKIKSVAVLLFAVLVAGVAIAESAKPVFQGKDGVAINGYDAVAYFSEGRPVKGKSDFVHEWMGAKWQFSSTANRDQFAAAPEKYAPQFGGYCAYGVAHDHLSPTEPNAWKVVDGKLYLNYNGEVQGMWLKGLPGIIGTAEEKWPALTGDKKK